MYSKRVVYTCLTSLFLSFTAAQATEKAPWFGNDNEFEWRNSLEHRYYDDVDTVQGAERRNGKESLLSLALGLATMGSFHAEAELTAYHLKADGLDAASRFDALTFQGRYLLMNDIVGEPFSIVAGADVSFVPSKSQREIGIVRHGNVELEGHLSIGREKSSGRTWDSRYWSSLALGVANRGSPWAKVHLAWEKNFSDEQSLLVFSDYRQGLGGRKLNQISEFTSYRSLDYAFADVGMKYAYQFAVMGELSASYAHRVYSQYTAKSVDTLSLSYFLPFGL